MAAPSKSEVKELSSVERELSIVIPSDAVKSEIDSAYQRLAQKVRLKGFRQGKVPRQVLEQYYRSDVEQEALNKLLGKSYQEAITFHALEPIADPRIESESPFAMGSDFSFKAKVEIKPKLKIKKWKGLSFEAPVYTVGEGEVKTELEQLQNAQSTVVPVTTREKVKQGDLVECNYSGTVEGQHVKKLGGMAQTVEVGSGSFFKEAEQALVGKKVGTRFEVDVTLPETYAEEKLRGQTAQLSISIEGIKARQLPAIDDEFAKDISDKFDSLEALKTAIMGSLIDQKTRREDDEKRTNAIEALIDANPFDVPPALIERQAEFAASRVLGQMPRKEAENIWKVHGESLKNEARPQALKTVQASLLCEAVALDQGISVSDEDLEAELEKEASRMGVPKARLRSYYKPEDLTQMKYRLANERALTLVIENAKIKTLEKSLKA